MQSFTWPSQVKYKKHVRNNRQILIKSRTLSADFQVVTNKNVKPEFSKVCKDQFPLNIEQCRRPSVDRWWVI
jgi:hypothetical protein